MLNDKLIQKGLTIETIEVWVEFPIRFRDKLIHLFLFLFFFFIQTQMKYNWTFIFIWVDLICR